MNLKPFTEFLAHELVECVVDLCGKRPDRRLVNGKSGHDEKPYVWVVEVAGIVRIEEIHRPIVGGRPLDRKEAAGEIFKTSRTNGPPDC